MATDNGNGVILINTSNPATPTPFLPAPKAALNSGLRPTLSFTGWPFPP